MDSKFEVKVCGGVGIGAVGVEVAKSKGFGVVVFEKGVFEEAVDEGCVDDEDIVDWGLTELNGGDEPWHASLPMVENGLRFAFVTYVRVRRKMVGHDGQENGSVLDCKSNKFQTQDFSFLPRMVADSHEEYKYLLLVQEILSLLLKIPKGGHLGSD
ncbi:hypothetical protein Droror1_Dr00006543 [Drosera rotundifolia]